MQNELMQFAATTEDVSLAGGIPLPLLLGGVTLLTAVLTAIIGGLVKKFRTPADNREDKVVVLDASEKLIERFQQIVKDSDAKHAADMEALSREVQALRVELHEVKTERVGLYAAIRALVSLCRRHGGATVETEIQTIVAPTGVSVY